MRKVLRNALVRYETKMRIRIDNPNNCLYCGKKLSFIHSIRDLLYCNLAHRAAHSNELNQLGLSCLRVEEKSSSQIRWEQCEHRMQAHTG